MPYSGRFTPKNPSKYKGDASNIIWRSTWEQRVMRWLDLSHNVIWWSSEELVIKYQNPIDKKIHRYFPDFVAHVKTTDGSKKTYVLEVKPYKQTIKPEQKRKTKRLIEETMTYAINQEKWRAADIFCRENGWEFKVLTEKDLGI
jgi:predicted P-loop ATPase